MNLYAGTVYKNKLRFHLFNFFIILDCEQFEIKNLLGNCLLSKHDDIKKGICDIVTQICNTEPDCKEFFTNRRFIFELLDILNYSIDEEFVTKALDALIGVLILNMKLFDI